MSDEAKNITPTQPEPPKAEPKPKPSTCSDIFAGTLIGLFFAALIAGAALGLVNHVLGPKVCAVCAHLVNRDNAQAVEYRSGLVSDSKTSTWITYCPEHAPAFDLRMTVLNGGGGAPSTLNFKNGYLLENSLPVKEVVRTQYVTQTINIPCPDQITPGITFTNVPWHGWQIATNSLDMIGIAWFTNAVRRGL